MKMKPTILGVMLMLVAQASFAGDPTAFQLIKAGDKYVGVQSKDKLVQLRSEKSVGTLTPRIWYVVYYDPDASLKSVQVKFGGGQKMDVSHPFRLLEPITGADKVIDPTLLKVDSNRALHIATSQPLLSSLNLTASQMWLQHSDSGPRWKVKLWAAKIHDSSHDADVGDVYISTSDGSVVRVDLHPNSAD